MKIAKITFLGSFEKVSQCPPEKYAEYAFVGRSNVGKSSLINMVCDRKNLAYTSQKPGKTQHLNFYNINDAWNLVDLPGYGYAKHSKTKRDFWEKTMRVFLSKRKTIACIFLLIDINVPPQKLDIEFVDWLGASSLPFVLVFTKSDRQNKTKNETSINTFMEALSDTWDTLPQYILTSSESKIGKDDLLNLIENTNQEMKEVLNNLSN